MEKLTVLCVPISAFGHTNATLAVATALRKRGHKIVIATERSWEGKFHKHGFHEELYDEKPVANEITAIQYTEVVLKMTEALKKSELEGYPIVVEYLFQFLDYSKYSNSQLEAIVNRHKPDVIIEDRVFVPMPALVTSSAPLIRLFSGNPLYALDDYRLPPPFLGLPLIDKSDWKQYREVFRKIIHLIELFKKKPKTQEIGKMRKVVVNKTTEWLQTVDNLIPNIDLNREYRLTNLNLIVYPKSLFNDYLELCPLGGEWMRLDYCFTESCGEFKIPAEFNDDSKKLIYFSLGTLGCSLVELMKRIVNMLSKSKHYFIVSKGFFSDQYELADNMWGESFLPQLDILKHVDLVITHGGNNTFIESLYFGKPMIVFPLFADQHDNAQRAVEMKIGYKFNPFLVEEKELNNAIDELLNDSEEAANAKKISKEMQESNCINEVVDRIEYVARHPKFPTITGVCK